jgi:hypothetical protein
LTKSIEMKFKVGDKVQFPAANIKGAVAIAWKNSNPNITINNITAFGKVLGAVEGSRSYSVAVQGVPQPVTLSSRCLKLSKSLRPHKGNSDDEYNMPDDDGEPKGSESFEHCDSEDDHVTPQACLGRRDSFRLAIRRYPAARSPLRAAYRL